MKLRFNEENINEEQIISRESDYCNKQAVISYYPSSQKKHVKNKKRLAAAFEDLEKNHNHSWIDEIMLRNRDNFDALALSYRSNTVIYRQLFENICKVAKSLKELGITPGEKIAMCASYCPEFIYFLGALNMIGARVDIFSEDFAPDYIEEIINGCSNKLLIATDNIYDKISPIVDKTDIQHKVLISLTDSLLFRDPYSYYDNQVYVFENKVPDFQKLDNKILSFKEFIEIGKFYDGPIKHDVKLNDAFVITYSNDYTENGRPKPIVLTNNNFISSARMHDKDLSKAPNLEGVYGLAHMPAYSNTNLITSVSDILSQGGVVNLEPIYDSHFFIYSMMINRSSFVPAPKSFWIQAIKDANTKEDLKNVKLRDLFLPTVVNEPTCINEEKFINKGLRKLEAGKDKLKVAAAPLSFSSGDGEHGQLFFRLYKSFYDNLPITKYERGLVPSQQAEIAVLREDGTECYYNELGRLVANSRCTMKEYENDPVETEKLFVTDAYGRRWADCKVWAYIDIFGDVHTKDRMGNEMQLSTGEKVPLFEIADVILKDTENILSCEVVMTRNEYNKLVPLAHVEMYPELANKPVYKILQSMADRTHIFLEPEIANSLYVNIRNNDTSFPLTKWGERSTVALEQEGLPNGWIKIRDYGFDAKKDMPKIKIKK